MAKGLAPQNVRSGSGGEFVSRVGLSTLELFDLQGSGEAFEMID